MRHGKENSMDMGNLVVGGFGGDRGTRLLVFNQFRYEMCTYADEIAGEVFHAGQEEFRIRKEEAEMTKGTYIIERQSKYQSGDSVLNGLKNSFGFQLYPKDTTKIHSFRLHLDPNMPKIAY